MTPLGSWLLLAETRMYKNTCNAPVDYKIKFVGCYLEIKLCILCIVRVANIWDIRAGRQMHKLLGHTKWIQLAEKC